MEYEQLTSDELLKSIIRDSLISQIAHEITNDWILNAREYHPPPHYINTVD
jgi:hypothetical protein